MIINNTSHIHQILVALRIDPLAGSYTFDGTNLSVPGKTEQQIADADTALNSLAKKDALALKTAADYQALNKTTLEQITTLEASIDTSRICREAFEGLRKKLAGLSPTADELWSLAKVQDVDNQIGVLRAKLK